MKIKYSSQFKKDFKRIQKQNKDINKLKILIDILSQNKILDKHYHDPPLSGRWRNYRECHISPDWLLIYYKSSDTLLLVRTGSHIDLFEA